MRLDAFDHDGEFRQVRADGSHGGQHRSGNHANGGHRKWDLHEGVALFVADDDAANVARVDHLLDFVDQLFAEDFELLHADAKVFHSHSQCSARDIFNYVMPARRILQLGDPMLREVSTPVATPGEAAAVFADLRDTLHEFRRTHGFGRGISAVQIGEPVRLIYIEFEGAPYHIRNPEYEYESEARFRLWDDCFSFPDLLVYLERSETVLVRYEDEEGKPQQLEATGALSELLQHEIDHLDGILAIDRAIDRNSLATREEYIRRFGARG